MCTLKEIKWHCTDPDIGQFGRKTGDGIYEFYTEGGESSHPMEIYNFAEPEDAIEIDISKFEDDKIKDILDVFGYYMDIEEPKKEDVWVDMNMIHWDKESREWIIAECIYEMNYE
jgi:hypothetical protein